MNSSELTRGFANQETDFLQGTDYINLGERRVRDDYDSVLVVSS